MNPQHTRGCELPKARENIVGVADPEFVDQAARYQLPQAKDGAVMYGMAYDVRMQQMLEKGSFVRASDWTCEAAGKSDTSKSEKEYDANAEACRLELSDTRLTVSATSLGFYESSCDVVDEKAPFHARRDSIKKMFAQVAASTAASPHHLPPYICLVETTEAKTVADFKADFGRFIEAG